MALSTPACWTRAGDSWPSTVSLGGSGQGRRRKNHGFSGSTGSGHATMGLVRGQGKSSAVHELALCRAVCELVVGKAGGQRVERVELRVGYLRQVVPDSMLFSWEMLTQGTDLEGCELVIDHVPAVVACRACDRRTRLRMPILMCESCESSDVTLVEGDELLVASIDRRLDDRPEGG